MLPSPNPRMQRTRSLASLGRSPLMRQPLGDYPGTGRLSSVSRQFEAVP